MNGSPPVDRAASLFFAAPRPYPPFYRSGIVQRSATRTAPLACSAADLPRPVPGTSACWCARRPRYIPRHARSPPRAHRPGIDLCRDGAARRGSTVGRSGLRPEVRINAGGLPQGGTRDRGVGREGPAHRGTDRTPFRFMNTRTRTLGQCGRGAGHDGAPRLASRVHCGSSSPFRNGDRENLEILGFF